MTASQPLTSVLLLFFNGKMGKQRAWYYDAETETSPLLAAMAELRLVCTRAQYAVPYMTRNGSFQTIEAIKTAIDDFAENEIGHREFFWHKPHSAG